MPTPTTMLWQSALSQKAEPDTAVAECLEQIQPACALSADAETPSLAVVFASHHHSENFDDLAVELRRALPNARLFGCSAGAVIGGGQECEEGPGLSVTLAHLPGVEICPFRITQEHLPDLDGGPGPWRDLVGVDETEDEQGTPLILLVDPYTLRADELIGGLDFAYPKSPKVGGLASGGRTAGQNALFLDDHLYRTGGVGVALRGEVRLDTLVAQGCRPIGKPLTVTKCERNALLGVDGQKPLDVLREIYHEADQRTQELIRSALFLGIVMDPFKNDKPSSGDFLMRNLMASDPEERSLMVASLLRKGMTVQFHVRDGQSAHGDLDDLLRGYTTGRLQAGKGETVPATPAGALLFSCLGRGKNMYGAPNHDSDLFAEHLGPLALGGFFCNGEIGPVGETTYIHGFTSCFGVFRAAD